MLTAALQPLSAWAEDRATLRSDPSAVPGAKTDGAARGRPVLYSPHRDWNQSDKPSLQNAATALAGRPSLFLNCDRQTFHFPLNQDRPSCMAFQSSTSCSAIRKITRSCVAVSSVSLNVLAYLAHQLTAIRLRLNARPTKRRRPHVLAA